ncbi:MAB_1171c family putative transporter [Streptomyces yaanensis]|uniref:MAB_1171c family putative transporter n=1 Tax=Streptomyces yaanensis TaxID=1142239 RepID=A0ABV7SAT0_9ACTN|nr:MAB_1171c family putative transporter [Streptomyces sp. CGMCC 4.7035]WNB99088.1 MAB_1171c family putative transporter [Streptomyces sp. CGMCC 4.7035]
MDGSSYYIPAAAMGVALTVKAPALSRSWRDPLLRSVCALLALAGLVFFFAAPPTIGKVNDLTGVTNVSAPLVYCLLSAFSASCLVLVVNWRGGPPEETRRTTRLIIAGYGLVIVALITLFMLGDVPVERLVDFDTYYARTPYIREMIVLYLMALTVAGVAMNFMCGRWALQVRGWLRAGLLIIVTGYLFNLAYLTTKFTAVIARWNGHDLDYLSSDVAPVLASAGAQISAVGFCLPLACQRVGDSWSTWSTYRRLGPLWRELRSVSPHGDHGVRISWWSPAELQVTQRESDIHDGMLSLYPYFDSEVRSRAYDAAVAAGSDPAQAQAEADAAMVAVAVRARAADPEGRVISSAGASHAPTASPEGPRDLVRMSAALRQSPVVAAARGPVATRPGSDFHEQTR